MTQKAFKAWWYNEGSQAPYTHHDCEEHTMRMCEIAWNKAVAAEREACVKECKKLFKVFLSSKYSTGQPLSSFKERHAVAACIESIEARGQA